MTELRNHRGSLLTDNWQTGFLVETTEPYRPAKQANIQVYVVSSISARKGSWLIMSDGDKRRNRHKFPVFFSQTVRSLQHTESM